MDTCYFCDRYLKGDALCLCDLTAYKKLRQIYSYDLYGGRCIYKKTRSDRDLKYTVIMPENPLNPMKLRRSFVDWNSDSGAIERILPIRRYP